ncbi:MAG: type II/IV secretion system protein [Candidatus Moraniibacteriota bacterium]|nr:MAG: type II/IV secretion system protein [Candidatus Moranbacteria bacterium]
MATQVLSQTALEKLLTEYHLVTAEQLDMAKERCSREQTSFVEALLWFDFISDEQLGRIIADAQKLPFIQLSEQTIAEEVLTNLPEVVARRQRAIVFREDTRGLALAMADPGNLEFANFLERKTGLRVTRYYATDRDITEALTRYHQGAMEAIEELLSKSISEATALAADAIDPPIIRIVNTLFQYAYQNRSSDIHLEPREGDALVRFRIDGVLHDIVRIPEHIHAQIISRIKVSSGLRTDEHQTPQDGKLTAPVGEEEIDVRVSVIPITHGEKVVLRLLSDRSRQFSLTNLGLANEDLAKVRTAYGKPYGMILVTGPTGCGKTTTLYSILKLLNRRNVNIVTIEDPVEYDVEGVNQIQVNPEANLTFANGIRSILRQDPNVILVGEIRDEETAKIAVNLAMTGHLVLSTLHTNNAATAIPRLIDMGIEPFLIASTVNVIVAERLVRTIHPACRMSQEETRTSIAESVGEEAGRLLFGDAEKPESTVRLYSGKGDSGCHGTGYQGRTGIFEVLEISDAVRTAIVQSATASDIEKLAVEQGMQTMLQDGILKAKQGVTTMSEVMRASKE